MIADQCRDTQITEAIEHSQADCLVDQPSRQADRPSDTYMCRQTDRGMQADNRTESHQLPSPCAIGDNPRLRWCLQMSARCGVACRLPKSGRAITCQSWDKTTIPTRIVSAPCMLEPLCSRSAPEGLRHTSGIGCEPPSGSCHD